MTNRLLFIIVAALIVIAAVVVILAYTYLDIGLAPKSGGALRVALQSFSAETLDPSLDNNEGLKYHGHLYDQLAGANPEGRLDTTFGLLSRWTVNSTADSFTLTLKEGANWHDGEPVISEDVRSSLEYYSRDDATCGVCSIVKNAVQSIEIVDDRNVILNLNKPDVVFMGLLAPVEGDMPLLPAHLLEADPAALQSEPVGSGPWRFAEKSQGASVEYEVNKDYWNADRVSTFDRLSVTLVPEDPQRIALMQTDKIDLAPIGAAAIPEAKSNGLVVDGPKHVVSTALRFFMSYDEDYFTSSLEFRKALALSADMAQIVEATFPPEAASVATGSALFTPVSPGFQEDLPTYPSRPKRGAKPPAAIRLCGRNSQPDFPCSLWPVGNVHHQRDDSKRVAGSRHKRESRADRVARRSTSVHAQATAIRRLRAGSRVAWCRPSASRWRHQQHQALYERR